MGKATGLGAGTVTLGQVTHFYYVEMPYITMYDNGKQLLMSAYRGTYVVYLSLMITRQIDS